MSPIRYVELRPNSPAFAGPIFYFPRSLELDVEAERHRPECERLVRAFGMGNFWEIWWLGYPAWVGDVHKAKGTYPTYPGPTSPPPEDEPREEKP
jgi:hypothetical protein